MTEFEEAKQRKERGFTVKEALKGAENAEDVIVSFVEDGKIYTSYSSEGSLPKLIGMLEISKRTILEQ